MTRNDRVKAALHGGHTDRVPFTMYECMAPDCPEQREMLERGMCIVDRGVPVFRTHTPNVKMTSESYEKDGKHFTRTRCETPVGAVTSLHQSAGFTSWCRERTFKSKDDYKVLLFMIRDEQYEPCYDVFARAERERGENVILRSGFGLEPLQVLVSGGWMGTERFCIEWMDNRDEVLKLYNAIVENRRKIYPMVAASPALHANYGGNVIPEVTGPDMFEKYYAPHYNEAAEIMHRHGKLIGSHFDDDCRLLSEAIAGTDLDYVEAFTPAPDTDMTLAEAREAWPDKVLWLNFPSSLHLAPDAEIERATVEMLDSLETIDGLIVGITEDMPPHRWKHSCRAIMSGLKRHAVENADLYR